MTPSDEILGAWIDGEIDGPAAAEIAAAVAADPRLAERVQRERALRDRLRAAYAGVAAEPVPDHLAALLRDDGPAAADADADAAAPAGRCAAPSTPHPPSLAAGRRAANAPRWTWGAIAASLLIGVVVGRVALPPAAGGGTVASAPAPAPPGRLPDAVAAALDRQLAGTQPADAPVRIGLTWRSRAGGLCRSYAVAAGGGAGVACHDGSGWQPRLWTRDDVGEPAAGADALRTASTALPPAVLRLVDDDAVAPPFDAAQERAAMARGWRADVDPGAAAAPGGAASR